MRRFIWAALTLIGLLFLSAFAPTVLIAPSSVMDQRTVFVIDHGTHSSLAIETGSGAMIRYAYGDKRYYATRDTSLQSGAAALLWPTPSTLGRGELLGPASKENLESQLRVVVQVIYRLEVQGSKADELIAKLDAIHVAGKAQHIVVPAYGLVFAPHPESYFWANNSSSIIAGWLRELGVGVFGWGLLASWSVTGA
jgi:hypothetical protein